MSLKLGSQLTCPHGRYWRSCGCQAVEVELARLAEHQRRHLGVLVNEALHAETDKSMILISGESCLPKDSQ